MTGTDSSRAAKLWHVYMLRTAAGNLYTGISTEPQRRLRQHENGKGGARSLRGKGPLQLVWSCEAGDRAAASRIEFRLKRCSKLTKEALVAGHVMLDQLLQASDANQAGGGSPCLPANPVT
jgi:putative endonuclease